MDRDQRQTADGDRSGRLDAALAEYLAAIDAGSPPDRAAWLAGHPDLAQDLADLLVDLEHLGSFARPTSVRNPAAADGFGTPGGPGSSPLTTVVAGPGSLPAGPAEASGELVLGRYRVIRLLGRGGFGQVYLATDTELDRLVAIKIPAPSQVPVPELVDQFLAEARTLARLDHPHIVPVLDVGRTADGRCFIVSRYIKGMDLGVRIRLGRLLLDEAAALMETICEAAHHAHVHDLVHRDIKPSNILLDETGRPYLTDFGLALRDDNYGRNVGTAGTPAYMSPEQARGEGHRVDGRSDVFSLGVVFYQLQVGRLPFRGGTTSQLLEAIVACEPRPPRQVDDEVPRELERICLKALCKRASERYTTARDMAADLRHYLASAWKTGTTQVDLAEPTPLTPGSSVLGRPRRPVDGPSSLRRGGPFVSKGLRSFDEHDAAFFLDLLPGPKDRDGLPESLSFWLSRIEAGDGDRTFRVGMIYGPSGSGKSSFVKAGLLPRLSAHVAAVYVEAAPGETENRLLRALRRACPALGDDLGLVGAVAGLRRGQVLGPGRKVLIVLDQFEQWLLAYRGDESSELYAALRQCDGANVQALLLVRDDFWATASRFMRDLDLELLSDRNMAAVDLFDRRHARKVLAEFGRGYHALPERSADFSRDQALFLDEAIDGLARDDKVIPVRLAVFAEMIKSKPWSQATLRQVGGADGLGVTFLDETFCGAHADPRYALHRDAARAVLKALLPASIADIKGEPRTEADLRAVSGSAGRPREFAELIHILCVELRFISLADPDNAGAGGAGPPAARSSEPSYQLTHDYLIRSIREWLDRQSRGTWRGRAGLLLADRTALWDRRRERRQLPSLPEFFYLDAGTRRRDRSPTQAAYLRASGRHHAARTALLVAGLLVIGTLAWDGYGRLRARVIFNQLIRASPAEAPAIIEEMAPLRSWVDPMLRAEAARDRPPGVFPPIGLSIALLAVDPRQAGILRERLLAAGPAELRVIRSTLGRHRADLGAGRWDDLRDGLWRDLTAATLSRDGSLRVACGLAEFAPDDPRWAAVAPEVVECLVPSDTITAAEWIELLHPARRSLGPELKRGYLERRWPDADREKVAVALTRYFATDVGTLVDLAIEASPEELALFIPALRRHPAAGPLLEAAFGRQAPTDEARVKRLNPAVRRRAAAATALLGIGRPDAALDVFRAGPDPTVRSHLIHQLSPARIDPRALLDQLSRRDLDPSARQALILALGTYNPKDLPAVDRGALTRLLDALFREHPDPGIHSAAGSLLDRLQPGRPIPAGMPTPGPVAGRDWYVNGLGQTFAVLRGPIDFTLRFQFGVPGAAPPPVVRPARPFALATTEVTRGQMAAILGPRAAEAPGPGGPDRADHPASHVSYFEAVRFCRRLSEVEQVPEAEMCYPPLDQIDERMRLPADFLERTGYRLPTEAEWLAACFGRARTYYHFGNDEGLVGHYARYLSNGDGQVGAVARLAANDLGLFDMLGNVYEWCSPLREGSPLAADDAIPTVGGDAKVEVRGGSYSTNSALIGVIDYRNWNLPGHEGESVGFRVARTCR